MNSFFNLRRGILIISIVFLAAAIWYTWNSILKTTQQVTAPIEKIPTDLLSKEDTDGDGLANWEEQLYGSNPNVRDSDGDGVSDSEEVLNGSDPTTYGTYGEANEEVLGQDSPYVQYEFEQIQKTSNQENLELVKPVSETTTPEGNTELKKDINALALVLSEHSLTSSHASTTEEFNALYSLGQQNYPIIENQISQMSDMAQNITQIQTDHVLLQAMANKIAKSFLDQVVVLKKLIDQEVVTEEELEVLAESYSEAVNIWVGSVAAVHSITISAGITFAQTEAGFMFMFQQ